MKIGIIGSGNIGGNLGKVWAAKGHDIVFGVRDPHSSKAEAAKAELGDDARLVTPAEAAAFGEVVVIAVPGGAVRGLIPQLGDLSGKIILDTTNRMSPQPGDAPSVSEDIALLAPTARVVKAYNTMGAETLLNPRWDGMAATAFVCGNDGEAKAVVLRLSEEIGLDVVDAGGLQMAHHLESFVFIYAAIARTYGRRIAFRMLRA
jgi:8-hydroxy-5-deazaflavin:NADPH oxidoreductase